MSNNFPVRSQDQIVGGTYRLGVVIHESAAGAVYETEFGSDGRPAVVKVRRLETGLEGLASRWRVGIDLVHPNLLRVYASGHSVVDGVPVACVVMERAEESLAGVLAERALSESETREMLGAVLTALGFLHKSGYAHSNLKPSNIFAVGDLVKLSTDDVTPAGDGGTPAADVWAQDMWALGTVIVEALTQHPPRIEDSQPFILREASEPFTDIVRHCLDPDPDKRWTVDQVQARLDSPTLYSSQVDASMNTPISVPTRDAPTESEDLHVGDSSPRTPKWIFVALAALVLIVFIAALVRRNTGPPAGASSPPASVPAQTPRLDSSSAPVATVNPAVSGTRGKKGDSWSVIVAAYGARQPAEKRSTTMARKWPGFKWSVFRQPTGKTYYLVVIGQNLSEDEAEMLRARAVGSGLPRDTYIKKLQ